MMKRICSLFVCVTLCAALALTALADMGGPQIIGYSLTLKRETDVYDWEWDEDSEENCFTKTGTLPAGTVLQISNEYKVNGKVYGYFSDDDRIGYICLDDLEKTDDLKPFPKEKGYKIDPIRLRVTDPKGLALHTGPSGRYPVAATLPVGAEVTVDTLNNDGFDMSAWMYISQGGKNGWAYCWLYDGNTCPVAELLRNGETREIWVVKDNAELLDSDGNVLTIVPRGEKLTYDSYNRAPHSIYYHVTYDGKSGTFCIFEDGGDNFVASDVDRDVDPAQYFSRGFVVNLYAYPDDKQPSDTVRYNKDEQIVWDYKYYSEPLPEEYGGVEWYHVEKNGRSGWINSESVPLKDIDWDSYNIEAANRNSPIQSLERMYSDSDEPETESAAGLAETTAAPTEAQTDEPTTEETTAEQESISVPQFERNETTMEAASDASANSRHFSPGAILGICLVSAAILALTAFITLRLIRRKQNNT